MHWSLQQELAEQLNTIKSPSRLSMGPNKIGERIGDGRVRICVHDRVRGIMATCRMVCADITRGGPHKT